MKPDTPPPDLNGVERICANCGFAVKRQSGLECHVDPPVRSGSASAWPPVGDTDWCGRYVRDPYLEPPPLVATQPPPEPVKPGPHGP